MSTLEGARLTVMRFKGKEISPVTSQSKDRPAAVALTAAGRHVGYASSMTSPTSTVRTCAGAAGPRKRGLGSRARQDPSCHAPEALYFEHGLEQPLALSGQVPVPKDKVLALVNE